MTADDSLLATTQPANDAGTDLRMKKTLLLCFIHGFKGGDDTFGGFPEHLRALLSHALPNVSVTAITYPKFETRGDLKECVGRFREWLTNRIIDLEVASSTPSPTIDPSVHTILIGHSMGGIVAADTLLAITSDPPIVPLAPFSNISNTSNTPTSSKPSTTPNTFKSSNPSTSKSSDPSASSNASKPSTPSRPSTPSTASKPSIPSSSKPSNTSGPSKLSSSPPTSFKLSNPPTSKPSDPSVSSNTSKPSTPSTASKPSIPSSSKPSNTSAPSKLSSSPSTSSKPSNPPTSKPSDPSVSSNTPKPSTPSKPSTTSRPSNPSTFKLSTASTPSKLPLAPSTPSNPSTSPLDNNPPADDPTPPFLFPHIQGLLAFDTPYLGIAPSVIAHGAETHLKTATTAYSTLSEIAGVFGWGAGNAANPAPNTPAKNQKALPAPGPASGANEAMAASATAANATDATPAWQRWGKVAMIAGAAGAVAAGGAAAYLKRDTITEGWTWVGSHLEFVGCLMRGEELKTRLLRVREVQEERGVGFADLVTVLGKGAVGGQKKKKKETTVAGGWVGLEVGEKGERTFCTLPKREEMREGWELVRNEKAGDEMVAHTSMFWPREHPGYYNMSLRAKELIVGWVDEGWYAGSAGGEEGSA